MAGHSLYLLGEVLGGFVGSVLELAVWFFASALAAAVFGLVGGLAGIVALSMVDGRVSRRIDDELDGPADPADRSSAEGPPDGRPSGSAPEPGAAPSGADGRDRELPLFKRERQHTVGQVVPLWVFLVCWAVVFPAGLAGLAWPAVAGAGIGAGLLTATATTWSLAYERFPSWLHPYGVVELYEEVKLTLGVGLVVSLLLGSAWWFIREAFLFRLEPAERAVVAPEATMVAFWAVFPLVGVAVVLYIPWNGSRKPMVEPDADVSYFHYRELTRT